MQTDFSREIDHIRLQATKKPKDKCTFHISFFQKVPAIYVSPKSESQRKHLLVNSSILGKLSQAFCDVIHQSFTGSLH